MTVFFCSGILPTLFPFWKHFKLPSSSVPRHIRKTFRSINHSVLTSLSHPHCRWIAPKTNGWSKQQGNFHLETRGVRWPPLVSLLACLLTHKWSPKSNPLVITVRGTVGSHRGSDGLPKSTSEKERWYRKWRREESEIDVLIKVRRGDIWKEEQRPTINRKRLDTVTTIVTKTSRNKTNRITFLPRSPINCKR